MVTKVEQAVRRASAWRTPARTPTVVQMEAVECGAASLGIILEHYGRVVPLTVLREDCAVSRDGANAARLMEAATVHGLEGKGRGMDIADLAALRHPVIVYWQFQHFLVVEGFRSRFGRLRIYLNDPASGRRQVALSEIDANFTGVVLDLQPGEGFVKGGSRPGTLTKLRDRWVPTGRTFPLALLAGLALVVPALLTPLISRLYFDTAYGKPGWAGLLPVVIGLVLSVAATAVLTSVQLSSTLRMQARLGLTATTRFMNRLLRLPTRFFAQRPAAELARRARSSDTVAEILGREAPRAAANIFVILIASSALVWQDLWLGLLTTAVALLNFAVLQSVVRRRLDAAAAQQASEAALSNRTTQTLRTIESVKAGGAEQVAFAQWTGALTQAVTQAQSLGKPTAFVSAVPTMLGTVNTALVVTLGGLRVMDGALTIGTLFAFQTLLAAFTRPVAEITGQTARLQAMAVQVDRLYDAEHYPTDRVYDRMGPSSRISGELVFDRVHYRHPGGAEDALTDVSFHLAPGKRIALVGASGSGKSTMGKIAAGLLHQTQGWVVIDGRDRQVWDRRTIASQMAYVDQEVSLFHGSVRDNVSLWDDALPDEVLTTALRDAEILNDVMQRPGGLNSLVAQEGSNYSGGQRQRLELARALAVNPALLILDEATSALDSVTEYRIIDNLRRRGCAVLLIAHRLSTIKDADEILVLSKGRVAERGTHPQLLAQGGLYAQLVAPDGTLSGDVTEVAT